jgi:hypothetical protein
LLKAITIRKLTGGMQPSSLPRPAPVLLWCRFRSGKRPRASWQSKGFIPTRIGLLYNSVPLRDLIDALKPGIDGRASDRASGVADSQSRNPLHREGDAREAGLRRCPSKLRHGATSKQFLTGTKVGAPARALVVNCDCPRPPGRVPAMVLEICSLVRTDVLHRRMMRWRSCGSSGSFNFSPTSGWPE